MRRLLVVSATGYLGEMIEEINSCQLKVKASKSDKQLRSYGHLKICMVSDPFWVHIGVSLTFSIEGAGAYSLPLRRLLGKILTTLYLQPSIPGTLMYVTNNGFWKELYLKRIYSYQVILPNSIIYDKMW